jgi:tetratricopeptide (TPR) repeat protein
LNEAATKVEENAEMRRMLGTSEMARNRLDSAVHEFKRAVELDPQDLDAKFGLAQALRKTGELDAARGLLDEIAARDPQFAQLTLERGQLFEAQNDYAKAVASYKQALEKEPTSMDLQLRLGAAQVEGNMLDDAEQTLQKVIHEIPNSAEAEYFIGRIAFARGRGPDALTHFDRALSLDGTQAVFHLYSARAALSMQNLGRTNEEINIALQRDPSLGDAYWVRGEVRLRTGQVKDALKDLQRALALKPNRFEVYAAMAECYDELRQREQSAQMWRIAVQKYPERGDWWYMLGRLYNDMGDRGSAQESLSKAKDIGDAQDPIPAWLPDVYRIMGEIARATNNKKAAIALYMRYLQIAPEGAMDKEEVRGILRNWEVELNDE